MHLYFFMTQVYISFIASIMCYFRYCIYFGSAYIIAENNISADTYSSRKKIAWTSKLAEPYFSR